MSAAWVLALGFDLLLHGGLLARLYLAPSPFLLAPEEAFRRIPLGYLMLLILMLALYWLVGRLGVRGAAAGFRLGAAAGVILWGAVAVGLYSISTASPALLAGWWVGQAAQLGLAGAVLGAAAGGASLRRIWALVAAAVVVCLATVVLLQSVGLASPMKVVRPDSSVGVRQDRAKEARSFVELEGRVREIMAKAGVPGLSCALLEQGEVAWVSGFGVRSTASGEPADADTVFAAASFSKPVFAYLVMLLAEDGVVELDRPLAEVLGRPIGEHPRYADLAGDRRTGLITARHALSHTIGFPNWRFLTEDGKLRFLFDPGSRFNYSGEGIVLLQLAVERLTGRGLEELARERVFDPLGMSRTSYLWQPTFEDNHAVPHDEFERPKRLRRRREADAAGSMFSTAGDYARFLAALMTAEGERRETVEAMLAPQVRIDSQRMFGPRAWQRTTANEAIALAWGLGWGRFDTASGRAFFHTGHDFGWQNYTVTYFDRGVGVVFLSNSDNFESVAREMVAAAIPEERSPFEWLGYPAFDPSRKRQPPPEPVAITLGRELLEPYAGVYLFQGDRRIEVRLEEDALWISEGDEEPTRLLAESETDFFVLGEDTRFRFVRAGSGAAERLLILVEGLELPAERLPVPEER